MITINGIELDFDITSPSDILRYKDAGEKMEAAEETARYPDLPPDDPGFMDAWIDELNRQLKVFGDFIDDVFGDGIAAKLLGHNPSLNKVADINDALEAAMEAQGREFGIRVQKYKPNRATRRAQQ
jgi:hypothetical protein